MKKSASGGRPRNSDIDTAILDAARTMLQEVEYASITMDAVANRAGTTKAAIYRRYASKPELMFAAAIHDEYEQTPIQTGSLRGDLFALGQRIRSAMCDPAARVVAPQVIAEIAKSPEVSARLRETFVSAEIREIATILDRASDRGEIRESVDVTATHRLLGGAIFFSVFVVDEPVSDDTLNHIVEMIVAGVTRS